MSTDPGALAATYFQAWQDHDFTTLRSILADDASFRGPLGTADTGEDCVAGLTGMAKMMTGIHVLHRFVDGDDVITWFELHTAQAPPAPTANWMHIEHGRIARIRVTFDPRPLLGDD